MSNGPHHRRRLSNEQEAEVVREYQSDTSATELASKHGYSTPGMCRLLQRNGVIMRSGSEASKLGRQQHGPVINRTYKFREDYFSRLDGPDAPQVVRWLGFLAADGCISKVTGHGMHLIVQVQARDRTHVEALASCLSYPGPIADVPARGRTGPSVRLCVSCTRLCGDLVRHGITPKKSLTVQPWGGDPQHARFWWGGYMDGDGTLVKLGAGWAAGIVSGSYAVTEAWTQFVACHTGNVKHPKRGNGTWDASYRGIATPKKIAALLYRDLRGSVPLARKKTVAEELLAIEYSREYRPYFPWGETSLSSLTALHAELGGWEAVAAHFGAPFGSLRGRLAMLRSQER